MSTAIDHPSDLLDRLPSPAEIQRRLSELAREERSLRQLMRISLRAKQEQDRANTREEAVANAS